MRANSERAEHEWVARQQLAMIRNLHGMTLTLNPPLWQMSGTAVGRACVGPDLGKRYALHGLGSVACYRNSRGWAASMRHP